MIDLAFSRFRDEVPSLFSLVDLKEVKAVVDKIDDRLKAKAKMCLDCPICRRAREKQRGLAYMFVKLVDRKLCPSCKALEQITGKRAYERLTQEDVDRIVG